MNYKKLRILHVFREKILKKNFMSLQITLIPQPFFFDKRK